MCVPDRRVSANFKSCPSAASIHRQFTTPAKPIAAATDAIRLASAAVAIATASWVSFAVLDLGDVDGRLLPDFLLALVRCDDGCGVETGEKAAGFARQVSLRAKGRPTCAGEAPPRMRRRSPAQPSPAP